MRRTACPPLHVGSNTETIKTHPHGCDTRDATLCGGSHTRHGINSCTRYTGTHPKPHATEQTRRSDALEHSCTPFTEMGMGLWALIAQPVTVASVGTVKEAAQRRVTAKLAPYSVGGRGE